MPVSKLCSWFDVPRRTVYYKPTKAAPKLDEKFVQPIKALIEEEPSLGYRTVAWLLWFNKNTVQRIYQIKGWQVRKRSIGARPRVEAMPSVAERPMKDGQPTCAVSGLVRTAGQHWRLLWIATHASFWDGTYREPAKRRQRCQLLNTR